MRAWFPFTRFFIRAVACAPVPFLLLSPRLAYAQATASVNGITGTVLRLEPNGANADNANENPYPSGLPDSDINFADCEEGLSYQFQLLISDSDSNFDLDVWAGTADCSVLANRQAGTAVCWPVNVPKLATTNPTTVTVRMQDIVSQAFEASHDVSYSYATSGVCQGQTGTGATSISLYFFFAQSDGTVSGSEATYPLTVGLRAAQVQGNISVGIGDTLLIVNVPPTSDPSVVQWNVYCDPPPGQESALESISVDAASNGGTCATASSGTDAGADASAHLGVDDAGGNACGVVLNDAQIPSAGGCSTSSAFGGAGSSLEDAAEEARPRVRGGSDSWRSRRSRRSPGGGSGVAHRLDLQLGRACVRRSLGG